MLRYLFERKHIDNVVYVTTILYKQSTVFYNWHNADKRFTVEECDATAATLLFFSPLHKNYFPSKIGKLVNQWYKSNWAIVENRNIFFVELFK